MRSGWRSSITKKDVQQLNVGIRWSREQSPRAETERSFGFAPPKHRLSPPISLVMSALLIQQGGLGGARAQMVHRLTAFSRASAESATLSELGGVREDKTEIRPQAENLSQLAGVEPGI